MSALYGQQDSVFLTSAHTSVQNGPAHAACANEDTSALSGRGPAHVRVSRAPRARTRGRSADLVEVRPLRRRAVEVSSHKCGRQILFEGP